MARFLICMQMQEYHFHISGPGSFQKPADSKIACKITKHAIANFFDCYPKHENIMKFLFNPLLPAEVVCCNAYVID